MKNLLVVLALTLVFGCDDDESKPVHRSMDGRLVDLGSDALLEDGSLSDSLVDAEAASDLELPLEDAAAPADADLPAADMLPADMASLDSALPDAEPAELDAEVLPASDMSSDM